MFFKPRNESGQLFAAVLIITAFVLFITLIIITGSQLYFQNSSYSIESEKAVALAEAGVDKAIASLNITGGAYNGDEEVNLGEGSFSVNVVSQDAATKLIEAIGYVPGKQKPKIKRKVKIKLTKGTGISFIYGIQVGEGGMDLGNDNVVAGSVYSNGSITAKNNNQVSGDIWVASAPQATPDQTQDCVGVNCQDFLFGKNIGGEVILDLAQSFTLSQSNNLNRVKVKMKKTGNPSDVTVRIMADKNNKPDKNTVLATGNLNSNLVTSEYGWVEVAFDKTPALLAGTTYWLMVDTSLDSSNYWSWQNDLARSYGMGTAYWSDDWQKGNPVWSEISGDLSFEIIMGGSPNVVDSEQVFSVGGDVHANTIKNLTIQGSAYYKTIITSMASSYFPDSEDPSPKTFPISDANVESWKAEAETNGTVTGDIDSCVSALESKKIVGNVIFNSNCSVTIKSPIWITGNLTLNTNNSLVLSSEYGTTSGIIIVDGAIELGSNNRLEGTGQGSSLLMTLSSYDSRTNGISAIKLTNIGNSGVFYASKGIIEPGNKNKFKELTAWKIKLLNNSEINYETGLSSTLFSSGPSGSFSLVKGSYQVK
ncbi:hypothetical protein HYW42_04465 [Candidatus Daviesbacteria bacterium]|nr:hypothetical protein [Candidatus Daviesbacteria bacterium]